MKKQILLLTFFVMAIFAGMNKSYGQVTTNLPNCISPRALDPSCSTVDALHPQPGVLYTYTVTTTNATDDVRWMVVNNADITSGSDSIINSINDLAHMTTSTYIDPGDGTGNYILSTTTGDYNQMPNSGDTNGMTNTTGNEHAIDITWKSFNGNLPNQILLVGFVTDDAGCTDNIFVYRIIPEFTFTLDIAALNTAGDSVAGPGETGIGDCFSPIESAFYNATDDIVGNGTLTVDWGENYVFFIVNAANFVDSWMPEFQITYSGGIGDPLEASWTYLAAATNASATWNTLTDGGTSWTSAVPVIAGGADANGSPTNAIGDGVASAVGGECIVVRVKVDHGTTNENADASQTLNLAVNGVMYDNAGSDATDLFDDDAGYEDIHHGTCAQDDFDNDETTVELTPRPEVDEVDPNPFENKTGDN